MEVCESTYWLTHKADDCARGGPWIPSTSISTLARRSNPAGAISSSITHHAARYPPFHPMAQDELAVQRRSKGSKRYLQPMYHVWSARRRGHMPARSGHGPRFGLALVRPPILSGCSNGDGYARLRSTTPRAIPLSGRAAQSALRTSIRERRSTYASDRICGVMMPRILIVRCWGWA